MTLSRPRLILSALRGGAGKTTLALALAAAWRSQDLQVAPFKKGPDYIDAAWLTRAAGRACRNLDPYLTGWPAVVETFLGHSRDKDLALIEGNRGLFDGLDAAGSTSTAELAKRLKAPVVLIIDCTKATRTIAALVLGCLKFDPAVDLAGVILNQVGSSRQEKLVRQCLAESVGLEVLGAVPRFRRDLPERHMGLVPPQEHPQARAALDWLADMGRRHLDLAGLARLAGQAPPLEAGEPAGPGQVPAGPRVRIGVIRDSAFQFYYPENLEALEAAGAEVVFISALTDPVLPPLDGLYIGGGFPETQAQELQANESFRESLRRAAAAGLPVYAECGGLMYLARSLEVGGRVMAMSGVLDLEIELRPEPQGHGYTRVLVERENPFYPVGTELKGHEFHYSRVTNLDGGEAGLTFLMRRGRGIAGGRDGFTAGNVLATYCHVHARGAPQWAEALVARARERKAGPAS